MEKKYYQKPDTMMIEMEYQHMIAQSPNPDGPSESRSGSGNWSDED